MPTRIRRAPGGSTATSAGLAVVDDMANEAGNPGHSDMFMKTKMCKFHILGLCSKGEQCLFAHAREELNPLPDLFRTKLCKTLINTGSCEDPSCKYAHNKDELRGGRPLGRRPVQQRRFRANGPRSAYAEEQRSASAVKALGNATDICRHEAATRQQTVECRGHNLSRIAQVGSAVAPVAAPIAVGDSFQAGYPLVMHPGLAMLAQVGSQPACMNEAIWNYYIQQLSSQVVSAGAPKGSFSGSGEPSSSSSDSEGHAARPSTNSSGTPPPDHLYDNIGGVGTQGHHHEALPSVADTEIFQDTADGECGITSASLVDIMGPHGGVKVKNTFLDFDMRDKPLKPLRTVTSAGGRLDLMG